MSWMITVFAAGLTAIGTVAGLSPATDGGPKTHVVQMELVDGKYRFDPARIEAARGDTVRFVLSSGAPHNVAFDAAAIPDQAEPALAALLHGRIGPLAGPLVSEPGASYAVVVTGVPPGAYPFFCMPHMSLGMTGTLVVK